MYTKVVAATLLCDRKSYSQVLAIPSVLELEGLDSLYINIETAPNRVVFTDHYAPLLAFLEDYKNTKHPLHVDSDIWSWNSSWRKLPSFDQDQSRLYAIVQARSMARAYMLAMDATHILFVDADVIVAPDGLKKLLAMDVPMCGGVVPGRGAHSHVSYVFGQEPLDKEDYLRFGYDADKWVIKARHGTCGYMLIRRDLMSTLAFRFGESRDKPGVGLSEDPAFCEDAKLNGFGSFYIHKEVRGQHRDDPENPMTQETSSDASLPIPI